MIKVPLQIMTSYDSIADERPVYTVIGKIYVGLSLAILSYDVIICRGTLIIKFSILTQTFISKHNTSPFSSYFQATALRLNPVRLFSLTLSQPNLKI